MSTRATPTSATSSHAKASAAAVELRQVTKAFGDTLAVDRLDLRVGHGEFVALLGPSGCGKTTCLRMIGGFEAPSSGQVLLAGADCTGVPPNRRDVNTVFQHYGLFEHLSVLDNVAFGLRQRRVGRTERRARAQRALELVRLPDLGGRRPAQLSGGQQQRVALARALVLEPSVLLLDEPLGALDLKLRKEMQIELKRIHREVRTTFIFVTHDQEEAMAMADRVAVMRAGRLEQFDTPDAVYDAPASAFVAGFVGETNFLAVEVAPKGAGDGWLARSPHGSFAGRRRARSSGQAGAQVGVRPEAVRVTAAAPHQRHNVLDGRVESVMELGDRRQLVVTLAEGGRLVTRADRRAAEPHAVGATVFGSWSDDDAILFEASS